MNGRCRLWTLALDAAVLVPLGAAVLSPVSRRSDALTNLSAGLGLVATSLLVVVVVLVSRVRGLTRALGLELTAGLHRRLGVAAVVLTLLHVVVAVATPPGGWALLDLTDTTNAARAATVATVVLLLVPTVVVPTVARGRYALRSRLHALAAGVVLVLVGVHVALLRRLVADPAMAVLLVALASFVLVVLLHRWVVRPLVDADAHVVRAVRPESPTTATVVLVPVHRRSTKVIDPGQFVWLRLRREVATSAEHPFTVADASRPGSVELTVRRRGAFTAELGELTPGRRVWLDGPHGALVPHGIDVSRRGLVLIAGGVGITPIISILRAFAAADDPRELRLLLAERPDEALFPRELDTLARRLPLTVTRVAGRPVDAAVLADVLPDDGRRDHYDYYLCGPPRMLGPALEVLDALGVPDDRVHTEQFG